MNRQIVKERRYSYILEKNMKKNLLFLIAIIFAFIFNCGSEKPPEKPSMEYYNALIKLIENAQKTNNGEAPKN